MDTDLLPREGLILCAVSGGADSVYLLCRLREMGYPVAAGHYNHGLRGAEADRDEDFVRKLCRRLDVAFISEKGDTAAYAAEHGLGLEEAGRQLRYAFLERTADRIGAAAIATAHTAGDNAETILLHLARGAGLKGLGGIPPRRGRIVRPMLGLTRREVEAWLRERGIGYVEDSTNASGDFARNRVRRDAVPALESVNPAFLRAAGQTAVLLREDEAFLEDMARRRHEPGRGGAGGGPLAGGQPGGAAHGRAGAGIRTHPRGAGRSPGGRRGGRARHAHRTQRRTALVRRRWRSGPAGEAGAGGGMDRDGGKFNGMSPSCSQIVQHFFLPM